MGLVTYGLLGFAWLAHYLVPHHQVIPLRCAVTIFGEAIASAARSSDFRERIKNQKDTQDEVVGKIGILLMLCAGWQALCSDPGRLVRLQT